MGADLILQLPGVVAVSLQDALTQDHQQLLRVCKMQQNPIHLEDEASGHSGEHQRGAQGRSSGGLVPTGCFGDIHGRTFQATNQTPKQGWLEKEVLGVGVGAGKAP